MKDKEFNKYFSNKAHEAFKECVMLKKYTNDVQGAKDLSAECKDFCYSVLNRPYHDRLQEFKKEFAEKIQSSAINFSDILDMCKVILNENESIMSGSNKEQNKSKFPDETRGKRIPTIDVKTDSNDSCMKAFAGYLKQAECYSYEINPTKGYTALILQMHVKKPLRARFMHTLVKLINSNAPMCYYASDEDIPKQEPFKFSISTFESETDINFEAYLMKTHMAKELYDKSLIVILEFNIIVPEFF